MDREALDANNKQDDAAKAPVNVQRVITDLEAADAKLAEHPAAAGGIDSADGIAAARSLLRAAIVALSPPTLAEAGEDTGTGKRRVKIKAESEVSTATESARLSGASKAGAAAAKSAARGARRQDAARARSRAAAAENAPNGSLLARLGAAADVAPPPPPPPDEAPPAAAEIRPPDNADTAIKGTADRLAQLEAEIADLTEAVTGAPKRSTTRENAARPDAANEASRAGPPVPSDTASTRPEESDVSDDDDDAEITIIGADGVPVDPIAGDRWAPRIFREGPPPHEDEAEVEIRGDGGAPAGSVRAERTGSVRISARPSVGASKSGALGRWRLFRGSS